MAFKKPKNDTSKYDGERDVCGFSQIYTSGLRVSLRQDFQKTKDIDYSSLSLNRLFFQFAFAKSIGTTDSGFKKYAWTKDEGGIFLRLGVNACLSFAKALEDYALYGEDCIYEKPLIEYIDENYIVLDDEGNETIDTRIVKSLVPLKTPGFSRVIGTEVKKTYKIVLNTSHYKDKSRIRNIGIIVSEKGKTCSITLELSDAYALAQRLIVLCNYAIQKELDIQTNFTLKNSKPTGSQKKVDLDDLADEVADDSEEDEEE